MNDEKLKENKVRNEFILVTGQEETEEIIAKTYQQEGYEKVYVYPEREPIHTRKIFNKLVSEFTENINAGVSFVVYTFSATVYYALMVAVHRTKASTGKCLQVLNNGTFKIANIRSIGNLTEYENGILDYFDYALDILCDLTD